MPTDRTRLRRALLEQQRWLGETDHGPQAVVAGTCDRCQLHPRLLPTCGPTSFEALCRDCAEELGDEAWCDGHLEEGRAARAWAADLPARWGDWVVLWWVATGEVRPTPDGTVAGHQVDLALLPDAGDGRPYRSAGTDRHR